MQDVAKLHPRKEKSSEGENLSLHQTRCQNNLNSKSPDIELFDTKYCVFASVLI